MFNQIVNFKTFFSCFISAIGYGFGFYVPYYLGAKMWICILICMVIGFVFDVLASKAVNMKLFEGKPYRELIVGLIIYAIYLVAWYFSKELFNQDLDNDLYESFKWMFGLQFVGWAFNLIKRYIKDRIKNK